MDEKIIIAKNIGFSYGKKKILKGINLEITKNKITALVGKNGSGKTTLARILVGLEKPESGEIFMENTKYDFENSFNLRGEVSLVFQNPNNQIIGNRVIDDLAFSLENRGISRNDMYELIENTADKLDITHLLYKDPAELSGGEKQIVAIAGIVIFNPKIIILDEITSMLDIVFRDKINNLLKNLKDSHTILIITHDPEEIAICDDIVYLEKGEVLCNKPVQDFYRDYEFIEKKNIEMPFLFELERGLIEEYGEESEVFNWIDRLK